MASNFIHLHVHTEYSLLDGLSKIKRLVAKAKEYDMSSVAVTDHGVMYGSVELYKAAKKEGIKPIIGMEAYVIPGDHHERSGKGDINHLVLLAKTFEGYQNLMKITTIAHLEGFYYKPRIGKDTLRKYAAGLVCLSACPKGEIGQFILNGNYDQAKAAVPWYQEVFGPDNYYLEIQHHRYADYLESVKNNPKIHDKLQNLQKSEDLWVSGITKLSRELGVPLIATNDSHYLNQTDAAAQDALVCISTGKTTSDVDRMRYIDTPTFHFASPEEMSGLFPAFPDAISNSLKIADSCGFEIELGKWFFPNIELPPGESAPDHLRALCTERIKERYPDASAKILERLNYELEVIITKGYAPYFLMLSDMVNWCADHGIITNTRGSAAGSVVSYVMGITTVDPIRYLLPFERFLNPFRPSPPDIDLDIADDRREELIEYVTGKYGKEKVAQICTFGRMLAKASIRDVGRVLGHPYAFPDSIAKLIPPGSQAFAMTLAKALETSPELKTLYSSDPAAKQLIDLAQQIEGNARHISVHAAGTVVSPAAMTDFTPLQLEPSGTKIITQYEFHTCEEVGLVKFDILGIRNLSILGAARDLIESTRQVKIDLRHLPLDDKKVFDMLSRGETMGVFQMGGSGMTKWLRELKPHRVEDLMIMIAIFRPGPMANIPEYIARKNGKSPVTYMHPKMEKFLDKSYGILVYQDDILFTALELAGYDWGGVDKFRKAIGKKIPEEMAKQHEIFVDGCIKTSGLTKEEAEKIWDLFVPFQGYGFNKAHAASYGIVSYQTAYLKAHYPVEYMTALLSAEASDTEKVVEAIEECRRMKVVVLAPDINKSSTGFTIEPSETSLDHRAIRFGFSAIKNVGDVAIQLLLSARSSGDFTSLTDLVMRVDGQKVNRKVLESLIKAGAMDSFGTRASMLAALDKIRDMGMSINKYKSYGQDSLFGDIEPVSHTDDLPKLPEYEKAQKLALEKEMLGFYLTEHPHADKLAQLNQVASYRLTDLYSEDVTGRTVITGGIVESVRNVVTKSSNLPMCFAKVSDLVHSIEVVVFPKVYAGTASVWQVDSLVMFSGRVESRQSADSTEETEDSTPELTIIVDSAVAFTGPDTVLPPPAAGSGRSWGNNNGNSNGYGANRSFTSSAVPNQPPVIHRPLPVTIEIPKGLSQAKLVSLNTLLQSHKGHRQVELLFLNGNSAKTIPLPFGLDWNDALKSQVFDLLRT